MLTVDRDYPGVAILLVGPERKQVRRVSPTPAATVVLAAGYAVRPDFVAEVFVVPEA
jgi:hypothetical protein